MFGGHAQTCEHCAYLERVIEQMFGQFVVIGDNFRRLEELIIMTQANIDALTAAVQGVSTDLGNAVTNISAEIAALQTANPALDLSALQAAVAQLQGVQASVDALETPAAPATPTA